MSRILIASPAMQIARVSGRAGGREGRPFGETARRRNARFRIDVLSLFSRPAARPPAWPSYRVAIRTRYDAINIPTIRELGRGTTETVTPLVKSLRGPTRRGPRNCAHARVETREKIAYLPGGRVEQHRNSRLVSAIECGIKSSGSRPVH